MKKDVGFQYLPWELPNAMSNPAQKELAFLTLEHVWSSNDTALLSFQKDILTHVI